MIDCCKYQFKDKCCCNCQHHLQDFYHCTTDWQRHISEQRCICNEPKGWICASEAVENGHYHSGWTEHGMCEMWTKRSP